jgi:hypothetical protein
VKSILESYLDQEIWILIRDKWYFAKIIRVWDDLLWFQHRTHNKETEEDTLWEMVVKISEVIAMDRVISVVSRKPDVFISQLIETDQPTNNYHKDNEN